MDLFDDKQISPMLIGSTGEPFDDPDFIYELKLDGERCLCYLSPDGTEFRNKRHKLINPHVPELTDIHRQAKVRCILDGELIVLKDGVPDFSLIQTRSITSNKMKIALAAKKNPATYVAYDILYYDGKQVTDKPLTERQKLLQKAFRESERLALSRVVDNGVALFELAKTQGLEGIVAKRRYSKYHIGKRTTDWIKIKALLDDDFVVCGYVTKEKAGRNTTSIILGAYAQDGQLVRQGSVVLGVSRSEFDKIRRQPVVPCPFDEAAEGAVYIKPELVCTVKFMERSSRGGLRQPVFKGLREDKAAAECVIKS